MTSNDSTIDTPSILNKDSLTPPSPSDTTAPTEGLDEAVDGISDIMRGLSKPPAWFSRTVKKVLDEAGRILKRQTRPLTYAPAWLEAVPFLESLARNGLINAFRIQHCRVSSGRIDTEALARRYPGFRASDETVLGNSNGVVPVWYAEPVLSSYGGATRAEVALSDGTFLGAISRCNMSDVFVKKVGTAIAVDRLMFLLAKINPMLLAQAYPHFPDEDAHWAKTKGPSVRTGCKTDPILP